VLRLLFQKTFVFLGPLLPYSTATEINDKKALDLNISILPSGSVDSPLGRFDGWLPKRGNGLLSFCPVLSDEPSRRKMTRKIYYRSNCKKSEKIRIIPPSV